MKLVIVLMFLFVQAAVAQIGADRLTKQLPDSSFKWDKKELQRWWLSHPRVESDGVVIGNTKYFILIVKPDPTIDYGMIKKLPHPRDFRGAPKGFRTPDRHPRFR